MKYTLRFLIIVVVLATFTSCKKDSKIINSFGYMNEKLEESIALTAIKNDANKTIVKRNLDKDSIKYLPIFNRLNKAQKASNDFYYYLESIKDSIYEGTLEEDEARNSYDKLIDSDFLDKYFFDGNNLTPQGKTFVEHINDYKTDFEKALGKGYGTVANMVTSRFRTKDLVVDDSGNIISWLHFKFESFPAMASIFNISQMQYDIRVIEMELIEAMNSGEFEKEFAMRNYTGIVNFDKGAYFPDDRITGRIVLGRFDESARPYNITVNGSKVGDRYGTEGAVLIDLKAPKPGNHQLNGHFTVMYDGTPVVVPFNSSYKVVSRDNIQEKIVYKTEYVEKPVYIDRPVQVKSKPASKPAAKAKPEPTIAPDAKTRKYYTTSSAKSMKIEGTVNNEKGTVTMLKTTLRQATMGAIRTKDNKVFGISSFKVKVPGQLTVYVEGNQLTTEAIRIIDKAKPGQLVTIFDIKAVDDNGMRQGKVEPVNISLQ